MQAVVKMPHIEINIKGAVIPSKLMNVLKKEYGQEFKLIADDGDELVNIFDSPWYKSVKKKMTPGKYLRIYRENKGLTQLQMGEALGGIPRQHISNMEHGRRTISLKTARKLSALLGAPIERFLETDTKGLPT
jgi:DNA-binding XRE family transcriptional regulator